MSEWDFHLLLAESLRMHYAKTLDLWDENFNEVLDKVREKYDEEFIRMWGFVPSFLCLCFSCWKRGFVSIFNHKRNQ
nr:class I SAM-dependent methyltransferase [Campylobacter jejuni]